MPETQVLKIIENLKGPNPVTKIKQTHGCIIGVVSGHSGGCFGGQFVELASGNALVNACTDFLGHKDGITVLSTESVTQLLQPRRYLIKMNGFLLPVSLHHIHLDEPVFVFLSVRNFIEQSVLQNKGMRGSSGL